MKAFWMIVLGVGFGACAPSSPEAISPIQDEIDASKPAKLEISLKLRDSTRVLSDVSVDVQWYEEGVPSKTSARSNASGVIALEFEHGAQFAGVIAHPSPYAAKGSLETSVLLLGGTTHEFDLVLNPAAAVMGTVYDVEGVPVSNAKVACFFQTPEQLDRQNEFQVDVFTTTDKNGRFALGGIPEGPFMIESGSETFVTVWRPGGIIKEAEIIRDLEVFVEPAHTVYGQVIDINEQPINDALIVAGKPNRRKNRRDTSHPNVHLYAPRAVHARSDVDGLFQLPNIPESQNWNLQIRHSDYTRAFTVIDAGQIDVWVEMKKSITLSGLVSTHKGTRINQVQLWLLTPKGDISVNTNIDGEFLFPDLGDLDDVYLLAYHPNYGTSLTGPILFGGTSQEVRLELDSSKKVYGKVLDGNGDPLTNVSVTLQGELPRKDFSYERLPEKFLGLDSTLSNQDGSFIFDNLYDNIFELSFFLDGKYLAKKEKVKVGEEVIIVVQTL